MRRSGDRCRKILQPRRVWCSKRAFDSGDETQRPGLRDLTPKVKRFYAPGFQVPVKDTTGAGDCFVAGFLDARQRGASWAEAGEFGNAVGALSVQKLGAVTGVVSRAETEAWMSTRREVSRAAGTKPLAKRSGNRRRLQPDLPEVQSADLCRRMLSPRRMRASYPPSVPTTAPIAPSIRAGEQISVSRPLTPRR